MEYYVDRYRVASGVIRHDNPNRKDDYLMSSHQNTKYADGDWFVCVPVTQKVQNFWMADFDVQKFSRQSA